MTEVATTTTTEDSPLWLKQRSSVSSTDTIKTTKVVDKELARLKNMGAVSSVWTNKFVQEDNSGGRRPSYSSKSPSPTHETFNTRIRSLSGNKKIAEDISLLHQSRQSLEAQHRKHQSSTSSLTSRFSKTSISSLDLTENTSRTSLISDGDMIVSPTSLESIRSQYDECYALLTKANKEVEYYKAQLAQESEKKSELERTSKDEAAALWFQCETLKTQFAQIEAKLKKANEDIDTYKLQLEEKEKNAEEETSRMRQLAELVVKQETLLEEYEMSLESNTDFESLREELLSLKKQKEVMENTIDSLRADLEMSHGQMRLMLTVSTEIQDEFENFKEAKENEMKQLLSEKDEEHKEQLSAIHQQYKQPHSDQLNSQYYEEQIEQLKQALAAKDRVIADIQNQLRTQRMSMDAQMMELTETILEKDALLMEFMSSRNNSREVIAAHHQQNHQYQVHSLQQQQQPTELSRLVTTSVAPADVTNMFYHPDEDDEGNNTPRIQMSKVRQFMYSESDSDIDEDDHSEVLVLSYSSDEDGLQNDEYYRHLNDLNHNHQLHHSDPTSPTSSIATYESASSSEEKVAEIKHFSYSSAQSQSTRPASLSSSIADSNELDHNASVRLSNIKESVNWPMPPPTPPPSEPLPPVPRHSPPLNGMAPPPRRGRSRTMVREEIPHINELPNILPDTTTAPVPPPRKAHLKLEKHRTSWMDDPEENSWHN